MLRHAALAVPGETLNQVADELLREGRIRQGYLGVGLQPVAIPEQLRTKTQLAANWGLMVLSVEKGTGADEAGLQLGDILVAAGSNALQDTESLMAILRGDAVGKPLHLTIIRGGSPIEVDVPVSDRTARRN
jgi:S1-C subfamily serine protease